MQLSLRRSQRKSGMMSRDVVFCLHAQIRLSNEERHAIDEYKLGKLTVYSSEKAREHAASSQAAAAEGKLFRGLAAAARSALSLRLTIDNLTTGQDVECKSLDEVLDAEQAIRVACENCKQYIETAQSFDGQEETIDFD